MPETEQSSESRCKMPNPDMEDSGISLLYVEDEPDTREQICEIIGRRYPDLRLLVAGNGEEGLRLFEANRPEIVLTDINMPVVNGLRMAEDIKLLSPATEIIALTAHSNSEHLLKAIEIGISHYILKPIDIEQIFRVIDKSLDLVRSERIIAHKNRQILSSMPGLQKRQLSSKRRTGSLSRSTTLLLTICAPRWSLSAALPRYCLKSMIQIWM